MVMAMGRSITADQVAEAHAALAQHGSQRKAAAALGLAQSTLANRLKSKAAAPEGRDHVEGDSNAREQTFVTRERIETIEQAIAKAEVDTTIWRVERFVVNSWEVGSAGPDGEVLVTPLWQVKLWLVRIAPKAIQEGTTALVKELREYPPKLPKPSKRKPVTHKALAEISLYDAHFGKRAWSEATGSADYDLDIARDVFVDACTKLLERIAPEQPDTIVLPIGHDFFNVDNWQGTTHRGTVVESVDDRFQKVFRTGWQAVNDLILACRDIATVEVLWVPGNHDKQTSWYMVEILDALYAKDSRVHIDNGPQERKYRRFGVNLFGYTHGDAPKEGRLPDLMFTECMRRGLIDEHIKFRAWRVGHIHKKKETSYNLADTHGGVRVQVMPSLSATDKWHYDQGFVGSNRCAEAWLWSHDEGYVGHFSTNTQEGKP